METLCTNVSKLQSLGKIVVTKFTLQGKIIPHSSVTMFLGFFVPHNQTPLNIEWWGWGMTDREMLQTCQHTHTKKAVLLLLDNLAMALTSPAEII